jgi:hypothetical protein
MHFPCSWCIRSIQLKEGETEKYQVHAFVRQHQRTEAQLQQPGNFVMMKLWILILFFDQIIPLTLSLIELITKESVFLSKEITFRSKN